MTDSDYDLLLTKDKKRFLDMLTASIWFDYQDGNGFTDPIPERYFPVFERWLTHYTADQLREFEAGIAEAHKKQLDEVVATQETTDLSAIDAVLDRQIFLAKLLLGLSISLLIAILGLLCLQFWLF